MTAAEVRSAWPLVADATDAQLSVAIANAETVVDTDLPTAQYNDALGAVAAHFARLRLEAGGSVPSSSAGRNWPLCTVDRKICGNLELTP